MAMIAHRAETRHASYFFWIRSWSVLLGGSSLWAAYAWGTPETAVRSIYLNGKDISSARSAEMKNVTVHINEQGHIFIIAPQYQAHEEDSYIPLRKYVQGISQPEHKTAKAGGELPTGDATKKYEDGTAIKAGTPAAVDQPDGPAAPKSVPIASHAEPPTSGEAPSGNAPETETPTSAVIAKPGTKVDPP